MTRLDPRTLPAYCAVYARRTPSIPWHNGHERCIGCGEPLEYVRLADGRWTVRAVTR